MMMKMIYYDDYLLFFSFFLVLSFFHVFKSSDKKSQIINKLR